MAHLYFPHCSLNFVTDLAVTRPISLDLNVNYLLYGVATHAPRQHPRTTNGCAIAVIHQPKPTTTTPLGHSEAQSLQDLRRHIRCVGPICQRVAKHTTKEPSSPHCLRYRVHIPFYISYSVLCISIRPRNKQLLTEQQNILPPSQAPTNKQVFRLAVRTCLVLQLVIVLIGRLEIKLFETG